MSTNSPGASTLNLAAPPVTRTELVKRSRLRAQSVVADAAGTATAGAAAAGATYKDSSSGDGRGTDDGIAERLVSETAVEMNMVVSAADVDTAGVLRAGELLKWIDVAACMSAELLAQRPCVTASMDDIQFARPIKSGALLGVYASVNQAYSTSMEVGITVFSEDLLTGQREKACSVYAVFVAKRIPGEAKRPKLPLLRAETAKESARMALANERKRIRLARKAMIEAAGSEAASSAASPGVRGGESSTGTGSSTSGAYYSATATTTADGRGAVKVVDSRSTSGASETGPDLAGRRLVSNTGRSPSAASATRVQTVQLVLPPHANHMTNTFGGWIMCWMSEAAIVSATRHCRQRVSVRAIDDVLFLAPSNVGDKVFVYAQINRVFDTAMEVGVRAEAAPADGGDPRLICRAYLLLEVADAGSFGERAAAPDVVADDKDAVRRYHEAAGRQQVRLHRKAFGTDAGSTGSSLAWPSFGVPVANLGLNNIRALLRVATLDAHTWRILSDKDGMQLALRERGNVTAVRLHSVVDAPPAKVEAYLRDHTVRGEWDVTFVAGETVVTLDDSNDISWLALKDRDFSLLRSWRSVPMGPRLPTRFVIASHSVLHDSVPEREGFTRAEVDSSGFIIEPVLTAPADDMGEWDATYDETRSSCTYIAQLGTAALRLVMKDLAGPSASGGGAPATAGTESRRGEEAPKVPPLALSFMNLRRVFASKAKA